MKVGEKSCVTPAGTSNELDVQNKWEGNTTHNNSVVLVSMIVLYLSLLLDDVLVCLRFCWCPCMAINVSVQYDGGFLSDIVLLTQCYYHRGTRLNAMKRFCIFSY